MTFLHCIEDLLVFVKVNPDVIVSCCCYFVPCRCLHKAILLALGADALDLRAVSGSLHRLVSRAVLCLVAAHFGLSVARLIEKNR